MLIDTSHRKWMFATLGVLVLATAVYVLYGRRPERGLPGGSYLGLAYGIVGFGLICFAGLLGARQKVPSWRVGRAQTWMRGHLWLGLLSLPLILFHGGFAFGGALTTILMVLLIIVTASGVAGAALQHYLPHLMTIQVPMEATFEEIASVRLQLRDEAHALVSDSCGPLPDDPPAQATARSRPKPAPAAARPFKEEEKALLRDVYLSLIRPFLEKPETRNHPMATAQVANADFQQLRLQLSPESHEFIDRLEHICEEARQLNRQVKLHRLMHGWLLVHVPATFVLLALAVVHAVIALRY